MDFGFIGLGNLGLPLADNLVRGGHSVMGFELNDERLRVFAENGGSVAVSIMEASLSR